MYSCRTTASLVWGSRKDARFARNPETSFLIDRRLSESDAIGQTPARVSRTPHLVPAERAYSSRLPSETEEERLLTDS